MGTIIDGETIKWLTIDRSLAILYLATSTCVVYDHLTTLGDEIQLVWQRRKWTTVQYLFFLNRYLGDATQVYAAFGNLINLMLGYMVSGVLCSMQAIMIYRVSSMYNHKRQIVVLLVSAIILEMIIVVAIQSASASRNMPVPTPAPNVHFCTQNAWSNWMFTIWIPIALFECLVLGLSLSLALVYHRTMEALAGLQGEHPTPEIYPFFELKAESLSYVLLRDSITFPFICVSLCIANFVIWITQPYIIIQISFAVAAFAPCILGSRLILNLREAYYLPFMEECNPPDSPDMSAIEYVDRLQPRISVNVESPTEDIHMITLNHGQKNRQVMNSRRSSHEEE